MRQMLNYRGFYTDDDSGREWVYGLKWFKVDPQGRLRGLHQYSYVYKRRGWVDEPMAIMCHSGFHAFIPESKEWYGRRDTHNLQLWIVAISGVEAIDHQGKFVGTGIRLVKQVEDPKARLLRYDREVNRIFADMDGLAKSLPGYKWNDDGLVATLVETITVRQIRNGVSADLGNYNLATRQQIEDFTKNRNNRKGK